MTRRGPPTEVRAWYFPRGQGSFAALSIALTKEGGTSLATEIEAGLKAETGRRFVVRTAAPSAPGALSLGTSERYIECSLLTFDCRLGPETKDHIVVTVLDDTATIALTREGCEQVVHGCKITANGHTDFMTRHWRSDETPEHRRGLWLWHWSGGVVHQ